MWRWSILVVMLGACEPPPCICLPDVGPPFDANRDAPLPDAPFDTRRIIDPPTPCGSTGTEGGHCRDGMCAATLSCEPDRALALTADLGIPRGEPDPDRPGELRLAAVDPTMDVSLPIATDSLCTRTCDVGAAPGSPDACSACGVCTRALGVGGLLDLTDLDEGVPSDTAGWCRTACTFDPLTSAAVPSRTPATKRSACASRPARATPSARCASAPRPRASECGFGRAARAAT